MSSAHFGYIFRKARRRIRSVRTTWKRNLVIRSGELEWTDPTVPTATNRRFYLRYGSVRCPG
jgi:hypothetical protein